MTWLTKGVWYAKINQITHLFVRGAQPGFCWGVGAWKWKIFCDIIL